MILGSLSDFLGDGSVSCIPSSSSSARYSGCIFLIFANTEERRGEERRGEEIVLVENEISLKKDSPSVRDATVTE